MFRKLFALEVAALATYDEPARRDDHDENDLIENIREVFAPRSGSYGSMWSLRSIA